MNIIQAARERRAKLTDAELIALWKAGGSKKCKSSDVYLDMIRRGLTK